ncbi:conserved hypothetical protein [Rhodospirillaceae bacterium LM-1]|nr:conserved hypothetical protein [Rhodospirillaceae bacterium LM-1]
MNLGATLRWAIRLRPSQVGWRLLRRAQRPFLSLPAGQPDRPVRYPKDSWPGDLDNGRLIGEKGRIRLLNLEHDFRLPAEWHPSSKPHLWRFALNYFEWLADLKAAGHADVARGLIADWLERNADATAECWHPYPTSLRLFSWLSHAPWLLENADVTFEKAFLGGIDSHARHLSRLVEYDVGGNHLIKNLKGLIAAAACLPSHAYRLDRWMDALKDQIDEQILPDGFHYERSPSYHLQVLIDLIDISDLLYAPPAWLTNAIQRMLPALSTMRHPDGGLALFNDGDVGDPKLLNALDGRFGKPDPLPMLPDAGYARLEAGDMVVIFDAGLCCPDHLTAHAHADTLSFEMSVGKERVIVNSGTYAYQDPLRNQFRGTASHSTIMVNQENCAEVFGTFRLGRRPQRVELFRDGDWIVGRHDGYRHLGVTVERRLRLTQKGLEGEDRVLRGKPVSYNAAFLSSCNNEERGIIGSMLLIHNGSYMKSLCKTSPHYYCFIGSSVHYISFKGGTTQHGSAPERAEANTLYWALTKHN